MDSPPPLQLTIPSSLLPPESLPSFSPCNPGENNSLIDTWARVQRLPLSRSRDKSGSLNARDYTTCSIKDKSFGNVHIVQSTSIGLCFFNHWLNLTNGSMTVVVEGLTTARSRDEDQAVKHHTCVDHLHTYINIICRSEEAFDSTHL